MSAWILSNLRLKLLALVLAVALLGAVAFSQNPIRTVTLDNVPIVYQHEPAGLILLDQPSRISVAIRGPRDVIDQAAGIAASGAVGAEIDLSRIRHTPGTAPSVVPVTITFTSTIPGISFPPNVTVLLRVDDLVSRSLPIDVRLPNVASGFDASGRSTTVPATVAVTGGASEVGRLTAFVTLGVVITGQAQADVVVSFEDALTKKLIPWPLPSDPQSSFDTGNPAGTVHVTVDPVQSAETRQVGLIAAPQGQPACGYAITGLTITPSGPFVQVTGPPNALTSLSTITLQPVSVAGATSNQSSTQNIPLPAGVTASPSRVTVTFQVQQKFTCVPVTATPSPTPSPTATP